MELPTRHRTRGIAALMCGCAFAVSLAACGSSDSADTTATGGSATSGTTTASDTAALQKADPGWKTGTPNARKVAFAPADNSESVRVAVISASDTNAYWHQVAVAVKEVAQARNAKVDVFNADFDPGKQQSQFQDALATGRYDAYIVIPVDGVSVVPMVKQAIASGAAVVATGDLALGPKYDTNEPQVEGMAGSVNTTNGAIGERLGNLSIQACEGDDDCQVAFIAGVATTPAEAYEAETIKRTFEGHPNVHLVAVQNGEFLADPSKAAASNILQAHPDLDVFVTGGDQMAYGAQLAIKDAGKTDQVQTIGLGGTFQGIKQIRADQMFGTAPLLCYDDGLYAADIALRAVRKQEVAKSVIDPVEESGMPTELTHKNIESVPFAGQFSNS